MHKAKVMIATLGFIIFGAIIGLYFVPQESSPYEDRSMMYIDSEVPRGASLEYTNKYGKALASYMQKLPEVENTYLNISPTEIKGQAVLKQINKRKKSGHEIAKDVEDYLEANLPGVDFHIEGRQRSGADSDAGKLTFYLTSARKREYLEEISEDFIQSVMSEGVLDNITTSVGVTVRDFWVDINRDRTSSLGVDMKAVADTIKALLNGENWLFYENGS